MEVSSYKGSSEKEVREAIQHNWELNTYTGRKGTEATTTHLGMQVEQELRST